MNNKKFFITEAVILLYTIGPLIALFLGACLAFMFGCGDINEGSVPNCFAGELIYTLTLSAWFALVTIPTGAMALCFVLVAHGLYYFFTSRHGK